MKQPQPVTIYRALPTRLSPEERDDRARELARQVREKGRVESAAKESASEFKEQIKAIDKAIFRLSEAANNGVEERDVECHEVLAGNQVTVFRRDTGEVVETRAATKQEMQRQQTTIFDVPGVAEVAR